MSNFDFGTRCTNSNERLNELLDEKEEWIRYLKITYNPQAKKSVGPFDGLWTGSGESESGSCRRQGSGVFRAFEIEIMVREQEITGRIKDGRNRVWDTFSVDASIRGTVRDDGDFDLKVGKNILSAELVIRGKLPKEGDRASGEWDTHNCHGKLTLNRDFRVY